MTLYAPRFRRPLAPAGFTLVEILIVVVILAILAAIVIPQFTSAAAQSRENSLRMNVYRIRQQIQIYQQQHDGRWPELARFADQMTLASNITGDTAAIDTPGYPMGPYLREVPIHPFTLDASVSDGAVGASAWFYDQATGDFRANDSAEHRQF